MEKVMNRLITATMLASGLLLAACGSSSGQVQVQKLSQPPSVRQVAAQLHLTGLTVCGPAPLGGVTDSGVAYRHGERIGIDTFPGPAQRDKWKKLSAGLGVAPFAQGTDWVAYKATDQSAKGCGQS
jgi:hypothetical protein